MRNTLRKLIALLLASSFFLSACSTLVTSTPGPLIPGLAQTLAAETLTAQQGSMLIAGAPTDQQLSGDNLPLYEFVPTSTPESIDTPVPQLTPFQNSAQLGSAAKSADQCVNAAEFITDISVPDNTEMKGGERFIKTWQFKNSGTCTWTPDYAVIFIWGDRMGGETPKPLGKTIPPGQLIEISTELQAPKEPGEYQGSWIFRDANGDQFGTGSQARQFFWVAIVVQGNLGRLFGGGAGGGCTGRG